MPKKERGLIMSHEMNLALRDGKKHETRRLSGLGAINGTPDEWEFAGIKELPNHLEQAVALFFHRDNEYQTIELPCPYGMVGTPMWIKEAHTSELTFPGARPDSPNFGKRSPIYKADKLPHVAALIRWREPYKMPRAYARTFVRLKEVVAQRLQDITNVNAIDEGMLTLPDDQLWRLFPDYKQAHAEWEARLETDWVKSPIGPAPRERFEKLICSMHKPDVWERNCWTWVLKFQPILNYRHEQG